jgi:plastocyanin
MRPRTLLLRTLAAAFCAAGVGGALAAPLEVQVRDSQGQALAEAIVFLESASARAAAKPLAGVEIAQQGRQFRPQVTVVTLGTDVTFPNRDSVRHHVYSFSPAKNFELKLYAGKPANPVRFDRPGIAVLGCNIHDQMVAWVLVVETPYFAPSDAQGRVHLEAPSGAYTLRAWHPDLPPGAAAVEQAVQLDGGASATVRLPVTAVAAAARVSR